MNSFARPLVVLSVLFCWGGGAFADHLLLEAETEATKTMQGLVQKLSNGTWMSRSYVNYQTGNWLATYWQYNNFKWSVQADQPTGADRLNGISWKGSIESLIDAYRDLSESSLNAKPCWTSWKDMSPANNPKWILQKVNGQWKASQWHGSVPIGDSIPAQEEADAALKLPSC